MSLLSMDGITKIFPGVIANDSVSFDLVPGEIHALVGENGAGKTTLMNILYGMYRPDAGTIRVRDTQVSIQNPRDAIQKGIGMVHQHFMLVQVFSVLDNIILGDERQEAPRDSDEQKGLLSALKQLVSRYLYLDADPARARIQELMQVNGLEIDLDEKIEDLPVGIQQRVEILKILYRGADILVFDEPTAVLTPQETVELFKTFRALAAQGKGIVFISHKLDEVLDIADRITVLRRGKIIETLPREDANKQKIAELMVGKPVLLKVDNPVSEPGDKVLELEGLRFRDQRGTARLDGVSLEVHAGEIVGIAGVEGNGQSELVRAIASPLELEDGIVRYFGEDISDWNIRRRIEEGIAHIPEDRRRQGLITSYTLADNLSLGRHHKPPFVNTLQLRQQAQIRAFARKAIKEFDVRTPNEVTPALALSGGNQQKVIIAREMSFDPRLLLATQPTRGVDVGAQEFIYRQIVQAKMAGVAVLLVSADLDEVLALADRVLVLYKGRVVRELDRSDATKEQVGYYMMGEGSHA